MSRQLFVFALRGFPPLSYTDPADTTAGNISIWWPPDRNISCSATSGAPYYLGYFPGD